MNKIIRDAQMELLSIFAKDTGNFALAGGTALELYYLHHRFSRDLDFFSTRFNEQEIKLMTRAFSKGVKRPVNLENKLVRNGRARVYFYSIPISNGLILKVDFIEDLLFKNPKINHYKGVAVYDAKQIYFQKIIAITGTKLGLNEIGADRLQGRDAPRDIFDIYYCSKKIQPLRLFLKTLGREYQRGMVLWYRTFSRQDFKLACLDMNAYDTKLDASKMILYLESEIEKFTGEI